MGWFKELRVEIKARRDGRRHVPSTIARATRDITGPTGYNVRNTLDQLEKHGDDYVRSFDRRLPPSTFVSERDRKRANLPMPVAERCIEDWGKPGEPPADWRASDAAVDNDS